ncbi:MAG: 50S ribosomal protein L22 [Armatimonadetes bacterium]|nr:50S ribosomal protein L22 [Armatimonadota bacterium]
MEVRATGRRLRVQPRKARLVAGEVKGKHAVLAMAELRYHPSKGAHLLRKVLMSAVANAVENEKRDAESLVISRIDIDEGMRMKRIRARAQGRANRILKRTSHITVVLEDGEPFSVKRSNAKPKPRPKFDGLKKKAKKDEAAEPIVAEAHESAEVAEEIPADEATIEETASEEPAADEVPAAEEPAAEEEAPAGDEADEKKEQE